MENAMNDQRPVVPVSPPDYVDDWRTESMPPVKLSARFQIVIPPPIRKAFGLTPGQAIDVVVYDGRITLIPVKPVSSLRGTAKGIDPRVARDADRV